LRRACVGLAYMRDPDKATINTRLGQAGGYEVNVGGDLFPVSVSLRPIYDPTNDRTHA
jgi:hypothetical protein